MGFLDDGAFRVFIESLCWACEKGDNGNTGITEETANWAFRRNVTETLQKLFHLKLLLKNEAGEIVVPKWEERQKRSDVSTKRVQDFRNRTKNRHETVSETLQKRNETVQEENRIDKNRREEKKSIEVVKKINSSMFKLPENLNTERFRKTWEAWLDFRCKLKAVKNPSMFTEQLEKLASWGEMNAYESLKNSMMNGWQGIFEPKNANGKPAVINKPRPNNEEMERKLYGNQSK